jgi:hypothetical protein
LLLGDLFPRKEALALVANGYLGGRFSLDSLKQNSGWFFRMTGGGKDTRDLSALFQRESKDADQEKRRQLAVSWLKEVGLMPEK